ncbi:MAG: CHASE2 domain-containing protein [Alphaproteobacteria bacterium]
MKIIQKQSLIKLIPIITLILAILIGLLDPPPIQRLRLLGFDQIQRVEPRPYQKLPVRIVDIDEKSLEALGQWPWPRTVMAELLIKLQKAGAAAVAFDILFAEPDRTSPSTILKQWKKFEGISANPELSDLISKLPDHDEVLASTLKRLPTVLGIMFDNSGDVRDRPDPKWSYAQQGNDPRRFFQSYSGVVKALDVLSSSTAGLGSINSALDSDGIIRRVPLFVRLNSGEKFAKEIFPTLSVEALRVAQRASTYLLRSSGASGVESFGENLGLQEIRVGRIKVPTAGNGQLWLHDTGHIPERYVSAIDLFESKSAVQKIRGHIVLIGTSAAGLKDIRSTPMETAIAGVEVHAMAIEQMILGQHLQRPAWMPGAEILWLFFLGAVLSFLIPRYGAFKCAFIALIGLAISIMTPWFAYSEYKLLVDPVYPSLVIVLIYVTGSFIAFLRTESEKKYVRGAFSRYLSPDLVEKLAEEPDLLKLGGETKEMTIMFSDIRGFTKISESMSASELTSFINEYLTPMTDIILQHNGTIDKYMGDAIMAFWNAPIDNPKHREEAAIAALAMMRGLHDFNESLNEKSLADGKKRPPVSIGIGINTGTCCVGNMGSDQRFDYSVLGDTANVASRLEGQSKTYGVPIVVGEETVNSAPDFAWLELDLIRVVGKDDPVRIFALVGDSDTQTENWFSNVAKTNGLFLKNYRNQKWDDALMILEKLEKLNEIDLSTFVDLYRNRISVHREQDLGPNWDGVYSATSK